jgi:alanine dehydrogenase
MQIGVPRETKDQEYRVALTPAGAEHLVGAGHHVVVEHGAGAGSGFPDADYVRAGAKLGTAEEAWSADLVVKVKEPLTTEYGFLRAQMLFTYLHLAGSPHHLTETLLERRTTALAYETVEDEKGRLPLLAPMSAIAGNMASTVGSHYLGRPQGGRGMQLGRVLGRRYGRVVVIGDGVVGRHAAHTAVGLGASVLVGTRHPEREAPLKAEVGECVTVFRTEPEEIARLVHDADLVVGAVLARGARAPVIVTEAMVRRMPAGSVIVDVSIDQGGCIATAHPTTHSNPVYTLHGVIHYCVANMPGAYPRTATLALTDATLPYVRRLADRGLDALRNDAGFSKALSTHQGAITCKPVAEALGMQARYADFR